jgi:hypothetical protein
MLYAAATVVPRRWSFDFTGLSSGFFEQYSRNALKVGRKGRGKFATENAPLTLSATLGGTHLWENDDQTLLMVMGMGMGK